MNEAKLCFTLGTLKHFINNALALSYEDKNITGYELLNPLLEASEKNTYVETVSNKADILYKRIKESLRSMMTFAYLNNIKRISDKLGLKEKPVVLAFDYTDEDFYGDVQGLDIYGWKKKDAVTGHFKFLTCSIISDDIPEKIPLITLPMRVGHYKSSVVLHCLDLIRDYIGKIKLILFDRGYYDNDLMYELSKMRYPFLIFVPKKPEYKKFLEELEQGKTIVVRDYKVNKDKSTFNGEKIMAFLKEIYDPRNEKNYDWIFATNVEKIILSDILSTYKKRWRIETQFRVQDDANIKCKSKEMHIRYFLFLFEQMLQVYWICFYKEETSFKKFIIAMTKQSKKYCKIKEE